MLLQIMQALLYSLTATTVKGFQAEIFGCMQKAVVVERQLSSNFQMTN